MRSTTEKESEVEMEAMEEGGAGVELRPMDMLLSKCARSGRGGPRECNTQIWSVSGCVAKAGASCEVDL